MKIKELKLYTNQLESIKDFYCNTLGFIEDSTHNEQFSITVGSSKLTFQQSNVPHVYHYCFLIPSNKLLEALAWMQKRTFILDAEENSKIVDFDDWNAASFYFYDGGGNVVELIVRYDLNNESTEKFTLSSLLCVNEIGMPCTDINALNITLENKLNTKFWKGDLDRFGTNGTQDGLFLLVNYKMKDTWFPTEVTIIPAPFEAKIENQQMVHSLIYDGLTVQTKLIEV
jgi:hypothetical protein